MNINQQREERMTICKSCPSFMKLLGGTCKSCGCNMIVKTWIPIEQCPENKWGKMKLSPEVQNES